MDDRRVRARARNRRKAQAFEQLQLRAEVLKFVCAFALSDTGTSSQLRVEPGEIADLENTGELSFVVMNWIARTRAAPSRMWEARKPAISASFLIDLASVMGGRSLLIFS